MSQVTQNICACVCVYNMRRTRRMGIYNKRLSSDWWGLGNAGAPTCAPTRLYIYGYYI